MQYLPLKEKVKHLFQHIPLSAFPIYIACIKNGNNLFLSMKHYVFFTAIFTLINFYAFLKYEKNIAKIQGIKGAEFYPIIIVSIYLLLFIFYGVAFSIKLTCIILIATMFLVRKVLFGTHLTILVISIGVLERAWSLSHTVFGSTSDMLPLVNSAIASFLDGGTPYKLHVIKMPFATYSLPLTYLPGLWLSYVPGFLLTVDLRLINVAADVLSVLLLFSSCASSLTYRERYLAIAFIALWFCNPYFADRIDSEISIFTLSIALFVWALSRNYIIISFITAGISLLICQLSLVITPFFLTYLILRSGIRETIIGIFSMLGIVLFGIIPFYGTDMLSGVFTHWQQLYEMDFQWAKSSILNFNFSVFAYYYKSQNYLVFVQALVCTIAYICFVALKAYRSIQKTLIFSAFTLLTFIQFNILVWTYLFSPVVILMAFGFILALSNSNRVADRQLIYR